MKSVKLYRESDRPPTDLDLLTPLNLATYSNPRFQRARHLDLLENEVLETLQPDGWDLLVAQAPPRHGKLMADPTPVLTTGGWKVHGDLRPGDRVYGPDGYPVRVVAVGPPDWATLRVTFAGGESFVVHPAHEWTLYDRGRKRLVTAETREIAASLVMGSCKNGRARARWLAEYPDPLQMPERDLPVDPYFLGVWLGDGKATGWSICGAPDDLSEIEVELARRGYVASWRTVHKITGVVYVGFKGLPWMRTLGLGKRKRIPEAYLLGSERQRRDLLRGLVDTDGHVDKGNGRVRIVQADPLLIGQIKILVESLGYRALVTSQEASTSSSGIVGKLTVYTVQYTPHDGRRQALLKRKQSNVRGMRRKRAIVSIEEVPAELGRCVQVASDDGLYLVGEQFIPTHNSWFLSRAVPTWHKLVYPEAQTILTSYGLSLARGHSRVVRDSVHRLAPYYDLAGVDPYVKAAADWQLLDYGGGMKAAGIGGDIMGRGADLFIIDDYLKNAEQAISPKVREGQWSWFQTNVYTRMEPGGKLIVLATRWHEDDLIGRLLKFATEEAGWRVREIRLPALAEPTEEHPDPLGRQTDEALWPQRWTAEHLKIKRATMEPYWWNALYQQRLGAYGRNEWPTEYFYGILANEDKWPKKFAYSATALDPSKGKNARAGDYSAIVTAGYTSGYIWVDADLQRRPAPQMVKDLVAWNDSRRPTVTGIEATAFQELLGTDYREAQVEAGDYRDEPVMIDNSVSKALRIGRLGTWLRLHRIKIRRSPGGLLLLKQLQEFPNSEHDDGPDALEMAIRLLMQIVEALRTQEARASLANEVIVP